MLHIVLSRRYRSLSTAFFNVCGQDLNGHITKRELIDLLQQGDEDLLEVGTKSNLMFNSVLLFFPSFFLFFWVELILAH